MRLRSVEFISVAYSVVMLPAMNLTLYQRDDCRLCDRALEMLALARVGDFACVFIDGDEALEARFGERVPVLVDSRRRELDWPFDASALACWCADTVAG